MKERSEKCKPIELDLGNASERTAVILTKSPSVKWGAFFIHRKRCLTKIKMMMANLERNQNRKNHPRMFWRSPIERFFRNDLMDFWGDDETQTIPSVNVTETDQDFTIELAAPGLKKEDFNIEIEGNMLMISSEKEVEKREGENEKNKFYRREYSYSSFSRSFALPENVDTDKISARYEDGVLKLVAPKKETSAKTNGHKINIE